MLLERHCSKEVNPSQGKSSGVPAKLWYWVLAVRLIFPRYGAGYKRAGVVAAEQHAEQLAELPEAESTC